MTHDAGQTSPWRAARNGAASPPEAYASPLNPRQLAPDRALTAQSNGPTCQPPTARFSVALPNRKNAGAGLKILAKGGMPRHPRFRLMTVRPMRLAGRCLIAFTLRHATKVISSAGWPLLHLSLPSLAAPRAGHSAPSQRLNCAGALTAPLATARGLDLGRALPAADYGLARSARGLPRAATCAALMP